MSIPFTTSVQILTPTASSVTAATSHANAIDVSQRVIKSIAFTASSITSGNGVFGVDVSLDGTNWVTYNRLIPNVANTNAQNDVRQAAPTISSNTTQVFFFPTSDLIRYISAYVAVTTDGTYSAQLQAA